MVLASVGCGLEGDGLDGPPVDSERPATTPASRDQQRAGAPPAPPPSDGASGAAQPAPETGAIVRAVKIDAETVRGRIVYAKEVWAEAGRVDSIHEDPVEQRWEMQGLEPDLVQGDLMADTIYVKELRCGYIEAQQVYAKKVRVGVGR
jgi:hypothetical protein